MADKAIAEFGRIDVLVNNAALYGDIEGGRFDQIPEEQWDKTMAVNVRGVWNGCKACVPAMREASSGSVINIASLAAVYGMPFGLHYATSKAAVIGMTRALARELGRNRIRVNAVAPSAVLTEGTDEFFGEKKDKLLQVVATGQSLQQKPDHRRSCRHHPLPRLRREQNGDRAKRSWSTAGRYSSRPRLTDARHPPDVGPVDQSACWPRYLWCRRRGLRGERADRHRRNQRRYS